MKQTLLIFLISFSNNAIAEWIEYSTGANGDVFYFDSARVKQTDSNISVWNRVRYKTSLMGASSYQSFLKIDCSEYSETILQNTFYSDKDWTTPAMATNTREKPKRKIDTNSSTEKLADTLCKE